MKKCSSCRNKKELSDFYSCPSRYDGVRAYCKQCTKVKQRNNREYYRLYQKQRALVDVDFRKKRSEWSKKFDSNKKKVHQKLSYALKTGKIDKGTCSICGDIKVDGHHEDYSKPLEVIWLCRKHHKQLHVGILALNH